MSQISIVFVLIKWDQMNYCSKIMTLLEFNGFYCHCLFSVWVQYLKRKFAQKEHWFFELMIWFCFIVFPCVFWIHRTILLLIIMIVLANIQIPNIMKWNQCSLRSIFCEAWYYLHTFTSVEAYKFCPTIKFSCLQVWPFLLCFGKGDDTREEHEQYYYQNIAWLWQRLVTVTRPLDDNNLC